MTLVSLVSPRLPITLKATGSANSVVRVVFLGVYEGIFSRIFMVAKTMRYSLSRMMGVPTDELVVSTGATTPESLLTNERVGFAKFVPSDTVSLSSVLGASCVAPENVLDQGHWFEMRYLEARSISTQMIERQTIGDWADPSLVGNAMGASFLGDAALGERDQAVSRPVDFPCPNEATILDSFAFTEQSFSYSCLGFWGRMISFLPFSLIGITLQAIVFGNHSHVTTLAHGPVVA